MAKLMRLVLFAGFAAALGAHAAQHWIVARTPHFEIYSDDSAEESKRIIIGLEEFRANFLHLLPLNGASEPKTTIVVFDRESDFRPYQPLYLGKPKDVSGYFLSRPDEVMIAMTTDYPNPNADPREVIYHEYVHLLLDARQARYPVWLNEGLAEVFSTFRFADGKVVYGEPKSQHLALLQHSALWPLPRLFAVTPESPDYNEEDRMGAFYAESWAFTHYLIFGADRSNQAKLGQFAQRLSIGEDVPRSFHETFGLDFAAVESSLRKYLNGGAYFKGSSPAVAQDIPVVFRPASDLERDLALLNLRWRVHQNPEAGAAALALLAKDPMQARPHELLAAIAASSGEMDEAQEHWQKAAERNSDNPWVYLQLLRAALGPYEGATMLEVRLAPELVSPWRGWASRALNLSRENHDAIQDALTIEALADKMDLKVANREQGPALKMRDRAEALLALAIIHWRSDQPDDARALVNLTEAEPQASMATRAAANALRYRLPEETEPAASGGPVKAAAKIEIALSMSHQGDAAKFLDQLLAERGSTAPWLKLDRLVVREVARSRPDVWERAEETRQKAQAGDAAAMFDLAAAYASGAGVPFSPALARDWLQQAIGHGYVINPASPGRAPPSDAGLLVQYLRVLKPATGEGPLPPLDQELAAKIAAAAAAADRRPPQVVYRATPRFPTDLKAHGGKGEAVVRFDIRADGHTDYILAREFSDPASASAAEAWVREWRFLPTIRDGQPADTVAEVPITFETAPPAAKP